MEKLKNIKLYKYLKHRHAESMMKDGKIRIGTYYEFKKMEKDKQRGDKNEGTMTYAHTVDKDTNVEELPKIFTETFNIEGGGKLILQKGGKVLRPRDASDN